MSNLFNTNLNELSHQTENTPFVSSEKISPLSLLTQPIPTLNNSSAVKMITADDLSIHIVSLKAEVEDLKNTNSNYINTINQLLFLLKQMYHIEDKILKIIYLKFTLVIIIFDIINVINKT